LIVDTHVHVLSPDRTRYPRNFALDMAWAKGDLAVEELARKMRAAGIHKATLVQAFAAYQYDNRYLRDARATLPDLFVAIGMVDPLAEDAARQVDELVGECGFSGIRVLLLAPEPRLDDERLFPLYRRCAARRVPLTVLTRPAKLEELHKVLRSLPDLRVVIEHLGLCTFEAGPPYAECNQLFVLAQHENLSLKFSTINLRAATKGKASIESLFSLLRERFGARRLMWGSDFPSTSESDLPELFAFAREGLAFLAAQDQAAVFGGNALELWP
jgi:predicted TIM-barrel fold metal-dependent hydrolase